MRLARILVGDVRQRLRELPEASVQTCITSPPYWGLRDYGTATWEGGADGCEHQPSRGLQGASGQRADRAFTQGVVFRETCGRCGARRVDQQIGLESTPEQYVESMVAVFREVRRVLVDDGVCWLNLGDCYATFAGGVGECPGGGKQGENWKLRGKMTPPNRMPLPGLKPKDLVGIPWRVAFALQADGWYLRSDIIWSKPNPMPESVTDRPTKAHEYVFLLSKSERYFYDASAIAEPASEAMVAQLRAAYEGQGQKDYEANGVQNPSDVKRRIIAGKSGNRRRTLADGSPGGRPNDHLGRGVPWEGLTRNKRTVWTITTQPFRGAHFATMPESLVEPCLLAGSRPGDLVLDPFTGSGTTAVVALRHERQFVGCELNPTYAQIARERIEADARLLNRVEVAA